MITGVPAEYAANTPYVIGVTVVESNITKFGFQLTAVDGTFATPGQFTLTHLPGELQILDGEGPLSDAKIR